MPESKNVTLVWVPGAWHPATAFKSLGDSLDAEGYENSYISLASVGGKEPLTDPSADVKLIRQAVVQAIDKGNDVIIVCHSYGGVPSCNASEGLGKKDRVAKGEKNGIINIVFMCSFALPKGVSLWNGLNNQPLPWFGMREDGWIAANQSEEIFYNDCSPEQQEYWKGALELHSFNVFKDLYCEYEAYKHIRSSYLVCELDKAIPVQSQEGMIAGAGSEAFQIVKKIKASHSPFLSMPQDCVSFISKVAEESAAFYAKA